MKANFRFDLILRKFVYFLRILHLECLLLLLKAPRSSTFFLCLYQSLLGGDRLLEGK